MRHADIESIEEVAVMIIAILILVCLILAIVLMEMDDAPRQRRKDKR